MYASMTKVNHCISIDPVLTRLSRTRTRTSRSRQQSYKVQSERGCPNLLLRQSNVKAGRLTILCLPKPQPSIHFNLIKGDAINIDVNQTITCAHSMTLDIIDVRIEIVELCKLRMLHCVLVIMACFLEKPLNIGGIERDVRRVKILVIICTLWILD